MTTASTEKKGRGWFKEEFGNPERRMAYYMVLPSLLIIVVVAFFPILYGIVLSLTDSTVTAFGSFVGLENYTEMFQDPDFRVGLFNTVIFTVASVTLEFIIGLGHSARGKQSLPGQGFGPGRHSGAVGVPDGHLGGHVAPDVPARNRDLPVRGRNHGHHQRARYSPTRRSCLSRPS